MVIKQIDFILDFSANDSNQAVGGVNGGWNYDADLIKVIITTIEKKHIFKRSCLNILFISVLVQVKILSK